MTRCDLHMYMLHVLVIVAFIGAAVVCHVIGSKNTVYRE